MADEDLTILDENKPDGDTEEVSVLDDYHRETRKKLKAFIGIEHDPVTGAHIAPHGASDPGSGREGSLWYNETQRELIVYSGGLWRSTQQPSFNYCINGMFDNWAYLQTRFLGWWLAGNSVVLNQRTGTPIYGLNSARIRATVDYALLYQMVARSANQLSPFSPYTYWRGKTVTLGAWIKCPTANCAYLQMYDGINYYNAPAHPGDGTWKWMTITHFLDWGTTDFQIQIVSGVVGANTDIAGVTLVEGHSCPNALPQTWQGRQAVMHFGSQDARPVDGTSWWYGSRGHATGAGWGVADLPPYDAIVRNLVVNCTSQPGSATFGLQLDVDNVTPGLGVNITGANNIGTNLTQGHIAAKGHWVSIVCSQVGGPAGSLFGSYTLDEVPNM